MLDRREIGQSLLNGNLELFLKIGKIFAIFTLSGKVPAKKDKLISSVLWKTYYVFHQLKY